AWAFAFALSAEPPGGRLAWTAGWILAVRAVAASNARAGCPPFLAVTVFSCWGTGRPIMGAAAGARFLPSNWISPASLLGRAEEFADPESIGTRGRIEGWETAVRMIAERPFTGEGLGAYPAAYSLLRSPDYPARWYHAHNMILGLLAETGALGLAGFVVLLLAFRRVWRAGWKRPDFLPEELAI